MKLSGASDVAEIPVICGPTAAGKSAVALWIAERLPAVVVSADSRQVYRRFDVGTAKPTAAERARVPHVGIDIVEPTQRYSADAWSTAADGWLEQTLNDGRAPIVVGGTGLYLRALFEGLFDEPSLDPGMRAALSVYVETLPLSELKRWVGTLDPSRAHLGRTQLLRTIEIAVLTGHRISDLHRSRARTSRWRPRYLLVDPGPVLAEWIAARIDQMLEQGWPDEVRRLMASIPEDAPAWNATGYGAVRELVRGERSRSPVRESILIQTRQYAKRQRTWFRNQLPPDRVTHLDPRSIDWSTRVTRWLADAGITLAPEARA
jgi:tRNA dimethylallyltransferase